MTFHGDILSLNDSIVSVNESSWLHLGATQPMNFDFDADPGPDPAAEYDANPYPAFQTDSDLCGSRSDLDPQHLVPICAIKLARVVLPEGSTIEGNRRQYGRRKGARSLGQLGIEEVVMQGLALHTLGVKKYQYYLFKTLTAFQNHKITRPKI